MNDRTRLHTNTALGMTLSFLLTTGLIAALLLLITETVDANGAKDIVSGALLPIIGQSITNLLSIAKRFTYISPGSSEDDE